MTEYRQSLTTSLLLWWCHECCLVGSARLRELLFLNSALELIHIMWADLYLVWVDRLLAEVVELGWQDHFSLLTWWMAVYQLSKSFLLSLRLGFEAPAISERGRLVSSFSSCGIDLSLKVNELVYDRAISLGCWDRPPPGLLDKHLVRYSTWLPPFSGLLFESLAMGAFFKEHCRPPHLRSRISLLLDNLLFVILQLL